MWRMMITVIGGILLALGCSNGGSAVGSPAPTTRGIAVTPELTSRSTTTAVPSLDSQELQEAAQQLLRAKTGADCYADLITEGPFLYENLKDRIAAVEANPAG